MQRGDRGTRAAEGGADLTPSVSVSVSVSIARTICRVGPAFHSLGLVSQRLCRPRTQGIWRACGGIPEAVSGRLEQSAKTSQQHQFSDRTALGERNLAEEIPQGGGKVFLYYFTYLDIGEYNSEAPTLGLRLGADHGAELPYVFGLLNHWSTPVPEKRPQAAAVVMDYGTNFATILDPNGAGLPRWKSLGKSGNTVMNLDQSAGMHPHPRAAQLDFLQAHSAK
jgi:carboxylesterase type B